MMLAHVCAVRSDTRFMELSMRARMMRNTLVGYFQVEKDQGAVHPIINPTDKTTRKVRRASV